MVVRMSADAFDRGDGGRERDDIVARDGVR